MCVCVFNLAAAAVTQNMHGYVTRVCNVCVYVCMCVYGLAAAAVTQNMYI